MTAQTATDDRRRWLALYVLCGSMLMIVLDATIVNVALPSIRQDLDFSQTSLAWVVNAYLLTYGGFLLLGGRLGDLFGHRRLFLRLRRFEPLRLGLAEQVGQRAFPHARPLAATHSRAPPSPAGDTSRPPARWGRTSGRTSPSRALPRNGRSS